ncbi:MAG: aminotransferase class I/II-fold pyridoxal phosphate-dependent enzyme, partial [Bryobacteraceae bacterium]
MLAGLDAVRTRQYPLSYDGRWWLDVEQLEAGITPKTKAVVVVNPNNPTGSYLTEQEYLRVVDVCRKHGLALVCDEVFADYPISEGGLGGRTLVGRDDVLTFVFSGLSKVSALPQMKLGWIVTNGPRQLVLRALAGLELIADSYLSSGAPVQWAATRLLELRHEVQQQIRERTTANLCCLRTLLAETVFEV